VGGGVPSHREESGQGAVPCPDFFLIFGSKWAIFCSKFCVQAKKGRRCVAQCPPKYATVHRKIHRAVGADNCRFLERLMYSVVVTYVNPSTDY